MSNRLRFPSRPIEPPLSWMRTASWGLKNLRAHRLIIGVLVACLTFSLSSRLSAADALAADTPTTDAEITRDANLESTLTDPTASNGDDTTTGRTILAPAKLGRREVLLASLTVFVLAVFLGFELITKVPPTLHTPLMSGSNAISGITLVGAILSAGVAAKSVFIPLLGMLAVVMATINAVGGFAVTHRMLGMFRRK